MQALVCAKQMHTLRLALVCAKLMHTLTLALVCAIVEGLGSKINNLKLTLMHI